MFVKTDRQATRLTQSQRRQRPAAIESLEPRCLLSAASVASDLQHLTAHPAASASTIAGYKPSQIRKAYGFDSVKLPNGAVADGAGQTIAIVTAYRDPNLVPDLHAFDAAMGVNDNLNLGVVNRKGGSARRIAVDPGWAGETALDVEWAHAIAPRARILVVSAYSDAETDMNAAVDYARHAPGVSVVSMSWGTTEFDSQQSYDKYFTTPAGHQGVTFVASSGDDGSKYGPSWPSNSPNVLAVGGTTLNIDPATGRATGETAWDGSGGGVSKLVRQPAYQAAAQHSSVRSSPDVAYNANPDTGVAIYNTVRDGNYPIGWEVVGGTSAGAPQWAGLIALANQARAAVGKGSLDGATGVLPTLYGLYRNPAAYAKAFTDITVGRSSPNVTAHTGYDDVTGLGSPKAPGVVAALVGAGNARTFAAPAVATAAPQVKHSANTLFSTREIDPFDSREA